MSPIDGWDVTSALPEDDDPAISAHLSAARMLVRARAAASVLSVASGLMTGAWAARAPAVQASTGADDAAWGAANSLSRVGALLGMAAVLLLIGRIGARRLAVGAIGAVLVVAPLLGGASSVTALVVYLAAFSFAQTLLSTPMTALTVEVQRRYGRPLLSTFGACWSAGSLTGAALGIVATAVGVGPRWELAGCSIVLGIALLVTAWWLPHQIHDPSGAPRRRRLRERFTVQLGLLAWMRFLTIFMATAVGSWLAIYTSRTLHAGPVWGAATYTSFTIANTLGLLLGGHVLGRTDQLRFFRLSVATGGIVVGLALLIATPLVTAVGFVILGLSTACIDPIVFGLGGSQPDLPAGEGISVVEIGDLPGGLVSAGAIGTIATFTSLRVALLTITASLLTLAISTHWIKQTTAVRPALR